MDKITALKDGHWQLVEVFDLVPGDQVWHTGSVMEVVNYPVMKEQGVTIDVRALDNGEGVEDDFVPQEAELLAKAIDFTGADLVTFTDETAQLCRLDGGAKTYSPRLPFAELNTFCGANMARYEQFFEANRADIEKGLPVALQPWWMH